IIDADKPALKKLMAPIIEQDVVGEHSHRTITQASSELKQLGFAAQVHAREINFFYLTDTYRERIVKSAADHYEVLHQPLSFNGATLKTEVMQHPERFSPNVVMGPLYQELILPNLAYIGGGGEIGCWLLLKANFEYYKTQFSILVPRNLALITGDSVTGTVFRLDVTLNSIVILANTLKNEYARRKTKHRLNLQDEWMELNAIFGKIKLRAHKIDPSLGPSTDAVKARLKKAVNNLEKKLLKAEKRNHEDALIQIERVKDKLFPNGGLQERTENFAVLYIKYGDELFNDLLKNFQPLAFKFSVLY